MESHHSGITDSLEDYLEVIYSILRENVVARVKDIAEQSGVSPASVTPAMKRLAEKGLISYSKRRYIQLTESGLSIARRTAARHNLLSRFLTDILGIDEDQAQMDACAMEHYISVEAMERLAAFFEFLAACPELQFILNNGFGMCLDNSGSPENRCSESLCPLLDCHCGEDGKKLFRLTDLEPETLCEIERINADSDVRRMLIDAGFLQGEEVILKRPGSGNLPCIISVSGYSVEFPVDVTQCILVTPRETQEDKEEHAT